MIGNKVISHVEPNSSVAEAFRILRTNLKFSVSAPSSFKSLLITSAGPGEGKSTIVANLATVMAQSGTKVIIVDGDLRKGEQHKLFDLSNGMGFADILAREIDINRVLKETTVPNLRVITSGLLPQNPAELLESPKTKQVISSLEEMADIVLIDSSPELMVADTALLSTVTDGVILVIRSSKTKADQILQAKKHLEQAKARIIGTVMNDVKEADSFYGYSGYYSQSANS